MKIAVIGFSGSGKSTLAQRLGELTGAPVLHLDTVQFLPGWEIRPTEEKQALVREFLDSHSAWVIDGNYTKLSYERRLEEADQVVFLLFNRFASLRRVVRRYRRYRGKSRPDMAEGCCEKLDAEFIRWVLWEGRTRTKRDGFERKRKACGGKAVVLNTQRQIDRWLNEERSKTHAGSL